jgi:hypothetical protein
MLRLNAWIGLVALLIVEDAYARSMLACAGPNASRLEDLANEKVAPLVTSAEVMQQGAMSAVVHLDALLEDVAESSSRRQFDLEVAVLQDRGERPECSVRYAPLVGSTQVGARLSSIRGLWTCCKAIGSFCGPLGDFVIGPAVYWACTERVTRQDTDCVERAVAADTACFNEALHLRQKALEAYGSCEPGTRDFMVDSIFQRLRKKCEEKKKNSLKSCRNEFNIRHAECVTDYLNPVPMPGAPTYDDPGEACPWPRNPHCPPGGPLDLYK